MDALQPPKYPQAFKQRDGGPPLPKIFEPPCHPLEPLREGAGPFRPNVAGLILRQSEFGPEILLGERCDTPGAWQWPQGGIDEGETPEQCLYREMEEEIGVTKLRILYQFPFLLRYRFPKSMAKQFKRWIGQEQHYFILALPPDDPPGLDKAETQEFQALRWASFDGVMGSAVWFKQSVYRVALDHAREVMPSLHF